MDPHLMAHEEARRSGWLEPDDPEWERAWRHFPDPVLAHPESGACLEYMGSTQDPERGWVHVFRHRQVPTNQQRQYWRLAATPGWAPAPQTADRRPQQSTGDCTAMRREIQQA